MKNVLLALLMSAQFSIAARLVLDEKNSELIAPKNGTQEAIRPEVAVYKIEPGPFDSKRMEAFRNALGIPEDTKLESEIRGQTFRAKSAQLVFEASTSTYFFLDESIGDLTEKDIVSEREIKNQAEAVLKRIIGPEASRFHFLNHEIDFIQKDAYSKEIPITYYARFAPKLNDRMIIDPSFEIRIGYGESGKIKELTFRDPVISPLESVALAPSEEIHSRLEEKVKTLTFKSIAGELQIATCRPVKRTASYIGVQRKGAALLLPHQSFLSENTLDLKTNPEARSLGVPESHLSRLNVEEFLGQK